MTARIERLTEAQKARFPGYVERWTKIGLCTEPAERERARLAVRAMYANAGLTEPRIIFCGSPLGNALAKSKTLDPIVASVEASAWASVGNSAMASVEASVWKSVWASVGNLVWASVVASVRNSVVASVKASDEASVWNPICGQHDADWLSFYAYFREVCGLVEQTEPLVGLFELAKSAGWALP